MNNYEKRKRKFKKRRKMVNRLKDYHQPFNLLAGYRYTNISIPTLPKILIYKGDESDE
jgi:hypothetical protein